jgi:hypothetical protein
MNAAPPATKAIREVLGSGTEEGGVGSGWAVAPAAMAKPTVLS